MKRSTLSQPFILSIIQFGVAFALSSVIVSLPFYVSTISIYSPEETLLWIGFIVASSNIGAAIFSPLWGKLSSKFSHKTLYQRGILSHAVLLFAMGFTHNLPLLLLLRTLQGVFGGISTIGLIMLKQILPEEMLSSGIGKFQSSITIGQLCGPAVGAYVASVYGFRIFFIFASSVIFLIFIVTVFFLENTKTALSHEASAQKSNKRFFVLWFLSMSATVQAVFFPAILPDILRYFNVELKTAVMTAGWIVFAYGISSALGAYFLPPFLSRLNSYSAIMLLGLLSSFFQLMHIEAGSIPLLVLFRIIQTFFAAAIMPLCISVVASKGSGTSIGIINTARFTGNACGPLIATGILSLANEQTVYLAVTLLSIIPLFFLKDRARHEKSV